MSSTSSAEMLTIAGCDCLTDWQIGTFYLWQCGAPIALALEPSQKRRLLFFPNPIG